MKRILALLTALLLPITAVAQAPTAQGISNTCGLATPCGAMIANIGIATGTLLPGADNTYDVGSTSLGYRTGYFDTSVVSPLHNSLSAAGSDITLAVADDLLIVNQSATATPLANISDTGALTTSAGITATTGNIVATAGALTAGTSVTTGTGNFIATAGTGLQLNAFVPTLAATPVTGTNYFAPGYNIIPTNAANNAGFLGVGTPVVGQRFVIYNNSGGNQRIKGLGSAGINGGATGTYLVLGYTATAECYNQATGNQLCDILAAPTSQGP